MYYSTCGKYYNLDPCHYFSALGLSWDAMLKMTGVEFKKTRDPDKYMFSEQGILIIFIKDILKHLKMLIFFIWI